ncbi:MAG: SPOR domain-containing protein [Gemmatimonadota bacterium]|nr:MAG: SPOR domain-containing protein [Gemmatimonadota bacterium]
MHLSKRAILLIALASALPTLPSCGSQDQSAASAAVSLERSAWLGKAEGWGLLGFPLDGGPLTYRSAETLESPTWAPPELERLSRAWPGDGVVWLQFDDSRIGRYDYSTGHLLSFEDTERTEIAATLGTRGLLIAADANALELVSEGDPWSFTLEGRLERLVPVGDGRVVVVLDAATESELLVIEPPGEEALARRRIPRVGDLAVTPGGERLYYLTEDGIDLTLHGLSIPELEDAEEIALPQPGRAVAVTPSGHRVYVSAGDSLHVFDRVGAAKVRSVPLPAEASTLRFSVNGAHLMARLGGGAEVAVLQVGVDSVLGVISAEWNATLPVVLPGGRLLAIEGEEIVLYDALRLVEVARAERDEQRLWLAVEWQPPRPRMELAQRTVRRSVEAEVAGPQAVGDEDEPRDPEAGAAPGYYAVVSAARERAGVDNLVSWLRSVGYAGTVDRHEDVMGVVWYRAMVGPYPDRGSAEEAARSLTARYGYKPWILNVAEAEHAISSPPDSVGEEEEGEEGEGRGREAGVGAS